MRIAVVATLALAAGGQPPVHRSFVEVFGQPSRSALVAGRPLGSTLALFRAGTRVALPRRSFHGLQMQPLSVVAAHMRGNPGRLVLAKTRRVGSLYLVPTTNGWACVQGAAFETCVRGLLRSGIAWMFQSTQTGIDVWGLAADDVSDVVLGRRTAALHDNVFFVSRPMTLTSTAHLPKTFGTLTVSYRDGRPAARVAIR